jgi:hypothetical protein
MSCESGPLMGQERAWSGDDRAGSGEQRGGHRIRSTTSDARTIAGRVAERAAG